MSALLPPNPDTPALYWLRHESGEPDEIWEWVAPDMIWRRGLDYTPSGMVRDGYTFASATQRPIPTVAQMDAVYALTADPQSPEQPAGAFALGYITGMEYAARKLREALGVTL